jgi:septum formation protein
MLLNEKFKNHNIILASGSPRRQKFLSEMIENFEIRLKDTVEEYPTNLNGVEITDFLAVLKANAFENELLPNDILITSDTIVWFENQAIGKPKDDQDATNILKKLSNNTHQVFTSVCFKTTTKTAVINDATAVTFAELTDEMIQFYIENFKPFDKAGAYGIQEWIGAVGVVKIEGTYNNIVGFPTQKVSDFLMKIIL